MANAATPLPSFWTVALCGATVRRAAKIALIVGVVIALINHGDKIAMGTMDALAWFKCILTFLVPYTVSTYSSVMAVRDRAQR